MIISMSRFVNIFENKQTLAKIHIYSYQQEITFPKSDIFLNNESYRAKLIFKFIFVPLYYT